ILAGIRGRIENEIRGLLKTFGVMFGKKAGGFTRRAGEIVTGELAAAPEIKMAVELLLQARRSILERLKSLDAAAPPQAGTRWPACSGPRPASAPFPLFR